MQYSFLAEFFKAFAHPLRLRVFEALRDGPVSVSELREKLAVEQSTLSQQLAVLRSRRLVATKRQGTTIRYEVSDSAIWPLLDAARGILDRQLISLRTNLEELEEESRREAV